MSRDRFVRRACADLGIPCFDLQVPENSNTTQLMSALIAALEEEYGKDEPCLA